MKLTVLIITFSISFTSWGFVTGRDFAKPINFFEKARPANNSGIVLKTDQNKREAAPAQLGQNVGRMESQQYPGVTPGEWKRIQKAEVKQ